MRVLDTSPPHQQGMPLLVRRASVQSTRSEYNSGIRLLDYHMLWLYTILLVLSPAILYGFALLAAALAMKYYRRPCFTCKQRGLTFVNWIRATVENNGKAVHDSWSYYLCEKCGAGFKLHHGTWIRVSKDEIRRFEVPADIDKEVR